MTAQVYIVLAEAKNVLTIPAAAVQSSKRPARKDRAAPASNNETEQRPNNRLELSPEQRQLVADGKASIASVRVIQADGSAKAQPILVGLNNRVTVEVIKGLKQGDQVIIADGSDSSNDAAKRSGQRAMRM